MSAQERILHGFQDTTALVIGDVMVDAYLWGRVDRISPEAPVPVVQVTHRSARLGGAANVALNMRALRAMPIVASVTGDDDHAASLATLLEQQGLPSNGLMRSARRRTTVKTRVISGHQHVVRVDEEMEAELDAADEHAFLHHCIGLMRERKPAVIVFEDYDKGVLTNGIIAGVIAEAQRLGIPVAVDPKRAHFFAYREVDLFKPNLKELREGLKVDIHPADRAGVQAAVRMLEAQLANKASLITLSEHGIYAHAQEDDHWIAAHPRSIADVSGAGDTVIAVAALCLAQGLPLHTLAAWANLAGGLVCEHVGVVPVDPQRLLSEAQHLDLA
ncbi:MAG: bifunctional ADP-heptose synthase [Flavobacteriales bacterium]